MLAILIWLITPWLLYQSIWKAEFLNWDDSFYILQNRLLKLPLKEFFIEVINSNTFVMGNYHPLTVMSYWVDFQFFNTHSTAYHIHNVVLHMLNGICIYFIFYKLLNKKSTSFILSLLFLIHPMHTENVLWISDRKDLLATLFAFLHIITWLNGIHKNKKAWLFISFLFAWMSILSKASFVVLPLITLIFTLYKNHIKLKINILNMLILGLLVLSMYYGILAIKAQKTNSIQLIELNHPFGLQIRYVAYGLTQYMVKFIYPHTLSNIHPYPEHISELYYGIYPVLCIGLIILYRRSTLAFLGLCIFLISLLPVLQLYPVGMPVYADRYAYFPYIGLYIIVGIILKNTHIPKYSTYALLVILCAFFTVKTFTYSKSWENSIQMWTNTLQHYPDFWVAYLNRGDAYETTKQYNLAIQDYKTSTHIHPMYLGYIKKAEAEKKMGNSKEAIQTLNTCLDIFPNTPQAYNNRALLHKKSGDLQQARLDLKKCLELDSLFTEAYVNLAHVYIELHNVNQAREVLYVGLKKEPNYVPALVSLGKIYLLEKKYTKARLAFEKALREEPHNSEALYYLDMMNKKMNL